MRLAHIHGVCYEARVLSFSILTVLPWRDQRCCLVTCWFWYFHSPVHGVCNINAMDVLCSSLVLLLFPISFVGFPLQSSLSPRSSFYSLFPSWLLLICSLLLPVLFSIIQFVIFVLLAIQSRIKWEALIAAQQQI